MHLSRYVRASSNVYYETTIFTRICFGLQKFAHKKSGSVAVEHKLKKRRMNMSKREKLEKKPTISEMQESALKIQEEAEANAPDSEQQPAEELGIDELKEKLHSRLSTFKDNRTRVGFVVTGSSVLTRSVVG